MRRVLALGYGLATYLAFLAVFAALADFLANAGFLRGIDTGPTGTIAVSVCVDVGLIALFGVSHSLMARPSFKERWTRLIPQVAERSTFVLVASVVLALTVWQWRPMPAIAWNVELGPLRAALWGAFCVGIILVVVSTFLTDHFDLFGLRQVWLYARGRPYTPPRFQERSLYKYVRHPMMVGILVWIWATPSMSVGHLVFALGMTAYVGVGIWLEERDLSRTLGQPYREYRKRVRALLPIRR